MIKSFRGQIANGGQDTLRLSTNKGEIGYKILKFQLMAPNPGTSAIESTMKIYKTNQGASIDSLVNFSSSNLLAAAFLAHDNAPQYSSVETIIFDNEVFNQDIFVTHSNSHSAGGDYLACNYYIELEQVKLNLIEATVATLKDMRGNQ